METVSFTAMKDGTKEDYEFLRDFEHDHNKATADRVLRELRLQEEETFPGYKISRLGSCAAGGDPRPSRGRRQGLGGRRPAPRYRRRLGTTEP